MRVQIFDTTLRDGSQGEGVNFSSDDKVKVAIALDKFGIDYIEGGWPGSNPKDIDFFRKIKNSKIEHAKITAFGSTRRAKNPPDKDPNLLALIERNRSGKGQYVSTSLLEGLVGILGFQAAKFFGTNQVPERTGNDHAMMSPYGTFKTKDGHINIAAGNQGMWERLCKTLGLETLIEDARFLTVKDRVLNRPELSRLLNEKLKGKNSGEWIEILNNGGIACGPILNIKEVFENEQVLHLKMLEEMDHPLCGKIKTIGIPTKLSRTPGSVRTPPPLKGEHTDEVLKELGLSKEVIASYHENKIV